MTSHHEQDSIDHRLRDALRTTARADATLGTSPAVEARLLADVRSRRKVRDRRRQLVWLAAAAAIVIAVTAARWRVADDTRAAAPPNTAVTAESLVPGTGPADFFPLRYANVPVSGGQIVQMVVPASAMESFGIPPFAAGGDAVSADVFVGDDGLARAVRFSPLTTKEFVP